MNPDFLPQNDTVRLAIVIALALQILFAAIGLVALARTPRNHVTFGKKWPWVLIIVFINTFGAILFFAVGRRPRLPGPRSESSTDGSYDTERY